MTISEQTESERAIRQSVAERYSKAALHASEEPLYGCCVDFADVPSREELFAKASSCGYSAEDIWKASNEAVALSMGCGNPTKYARFHPGEMVLDIGCGAGLDSILASKAVGTYGTVLATDLTTRMLELSKRNSQDLKLKNLEFIRCDAENLPFLEKSVHHVIANCSINLMPNKRKVLEEAHRVIKETGQVTFSDILSTVPLPEEFKKNVELWAACIAGVVTEESFLQGLEAAGFKSIRVLDRKIFHYGAKDTARISKFFGERSDLASSILDLENRVETVIVQAQKE